MSLYHHHSTGIPWQQFTSAPQATAASTFYTATSGNTAFHHHSHPPFYTGIATFSSTDATQLATHARRNKSSWPIGITLLFIKHTTKNTQTNSKHKNRTLSHLSRSGLTNLHNIMSLQMKGTREKNQVSVEPHDLEVVIFTHAQ